MNANQWFAKAAPSNLGEGVANLVADIAKAKWAELNKASVPGVSQVAGPNMLNDRMALSYVTDIGYVGRSRSSRWSPTGRSAANTTSGIWTRSRRRV